MGGASGNAAPAGALSSPRPRRRNVEVSSHTSSPAACTVVHMSKTWPLAWGRRFSARAVTWSFSCTVTGRCWVMVFSRCTVPIAGNGNDASVMIAMCSPKASMCG